MEPMIFKTPERKHFLIEALEYCTFADIYRSLWKAYKTEGTPTPVFLFALLSAAIISGLGVWIIASGIGQILLWLILGMVYATGRRDRDIEAREAGAEFAIKVIEAVVADLNMQAESEKKEDAVDETETK